VGQHFAQPFSPNSTATQLIRVLHITYLHTTEMISRLSVLVVVLVLCLSGAIAKANVVDNYISYALSHAQPRSTGWCAAYVWRALTNTGVRIASEPEARLYGQNLINAGFRQVGDLKTGDIRVYQPAGRCNPAGHIQIWTGSVWVSDYVSSASGTANSCWGSVPTTTWRLGAGGSGSPSPAPAPAPAPSGGGWAFNKPSASVQASIQAALKRRGRYSGPADGAWGGNSIKGIQLTARNVGYTGPIDGAPGAKLCYYVQVYAKKFGGYRGPIDSVLGPASWAAFAKGLAA
jgi:hypothetical protein